MDYSTIISGGVEILHSLSSKRDACIYSCKPNVESGQFQYSSCYNCLGPSTT